MALLFIDGFDHSGTSGGIHATKYSSSGGTVSVVSSPVRTGAGAAALGGATGGSLGKSAYSIGLGMPAILGFAVRFSLLSADRICAFQESGTEHVGLALTAAGQLIVYRGTTASVLGTSTTTLVVNTWYYLEFKAAVHDTTGSYEVRIDGVPEATLTASGVDTRAAATGVLTGFFIRGSGASGEKFYFDDLYFCDGTGTIRNSFLGPCKVETLLPQTDAVAAGSNAGLTPSTGTDHGALVDENPPNTTDYNSSPTVGLKDTYNYPSLALTGTVLGVQTDLYVAKSDAVARQVCAVVRAGGVDYDGANVSPLTTFSYFSEVRAQNPNTSADWTNSDLASLQAGMKVTA
jgi:hypothetical protein